MPVCKNCNEYFHYGVDCDREDYYELGYCCKQCMVTSKEYTGAIDNATKFVGSLSDNQLVMFKQFIDDYYDFEEAIDQALNLY